MDLKDFYRLVLRNLLVVAISTFLGIGFAAGITLTATPMYESKVQLFVSTQNSGIDLSALVQGSSFSQQRVKSYAQIINSPTVLEPVIKLIGAPITAEKLSKRVKASAPLDTVLINVSVQDESAVRSALLANQIGTYFATYVNDLELAGENFLPAIKVSLVKKAATPESPATPRVQLNLLLGLILGFGLGVGLAIMRQIFDSTIKNENDLDGTPLLGTVGFDEDAQTKPLLTQLSRYSARTEAFRQLRTNLQYLRADDPPKVIAVTSAVPGEGKTSSSLNLALSLSQSGFRTAYVEADMRRPKVSKYLGIESKAQGLSEILKGELEIYYSSPASESLMMTFVPAGKIPPNPAELLDSARFESVINHLRSTHDYVIIDCPPALPVADATIVATQVDGVLVVVEAASTRRNQFFGVRDAINHVGGQVLGVLLNKIPQTRSYYDYGYRYGYGYGYKGRYGRYGYKNYQPYASSDAKDEANRS